MHGSIMLNWPARLAGVSADCQPPASLSRQYIIGATVTRPARHLSFILVPYGEIFSVVVCIP